jgi:hypothetical protein
MDQHDVQRKYAMGVHSSKRFRQNEWSAGAPDKFDDSPPNVFYGCFSTLVIARRVVLMSLAALFF